MNRYNKQKHLNVKDLIYRFIVTIIAIAIVCSYLPRDDRYSYQFDLDKPWRYSQLIASFDFPIYKSPESIQKEQQIEEIDYGIKEFIIEIRVLLNYRLGEILSAK